MIGQNLRQFRIETKIGSGAMGVVYRALDEKRNRPAAVKIITGEAGNKGVASARFKREAELLQQFQHPNIVRFLGGGQYQGTLYIAMEFITGGTLEQALEQRGFYPWREAVEIAIQICDALQYAHDRSVVHRDLKPSNLMLTADGRVKLTDFGIAKDLDAAALTATGRTLGTAAYMAPEQIRVTPGISHKTDLYSLGCVLYQLLTGQPPFTGKSAVVLMHLHLNEPPPRPSAKNPDMPMALDNLVVQLMAKDPKQRPWDAAAAGHILTELKQKAERGEPISMVFNKAEAPTRLGGETTPTIGQTAVKTRKAGTKKAATRTLGGEIQHSHAGTIGLVVAAIGLIGLMAYLLWPPSAAYLYGKAEALMATDSRSNWLHAREWYIEELERRFPGYRAEDLQEWRDKIALFDAEGRAQRLERPALASDRPKGDAEELFVETFHRANDASKAGQDPDAHKAWSQMAFALAEKPEFRGWVKLAEARAAALAKAMERRRTLALHKLALAEKVEQENQNPREAARLRQEVIDEYGRFSDMLDLVERARAGLPTPEGSPPP